MKTAKLATPQDRIKFLMREFKYDEGSFAHRLGVSPIAITNVTKNGKAPSYTMMTNITKILPVAEKWLFFGEGKPYTEKIEPYMNGAKALSKHRGVDHDIKDRIIKIREEAKLTQALFAGELKVTRDVISAIEIAKTSPSAQLIREIASTFAVNPIWILYGLGEKTWKPFKNS